MEAGLVGVAERITCGADRLVCFLRVLHLRRIHARLRGQELLAIEILHLCAGGFHRRGGQGDGVGTHVGDEALLVQGLRHGHRPLCGEAELAPCFLLERRGAERFVGTAAVRLRLDAVDLHRGLEERLGQGLRRCFVEYGEGIVLDAPLVVEVTALGDLGAVDGGQPGREFAWILVGAGVQREIEIPVGGGHECDAFTLAIDDEASRDGLDAACRELRHDLLPEHWRDLVAVEAVEDAAGLLRVDQVFVEVAGVGDRLEDRGLGDLVEHHPLDGNLRLQLLEQMPCDGFALAVTIRGQQEFVDVLELGLQVPDRGLLVLRDDVDRGEVVVDVDAGARPRLTLVLGGDLGGSGRKIAHVPTTRLHDVVAAEVAGDLGRLGGRLDNHEALAHADLSLGVGGNSTRTIACAVKDDRTGSHPQGWMDGPQFAF